MRFLLFILFLLIAGVVGIAWYGLSEGRLTPGSDVVVDDAKAGQLLSKLDPRGLQAGDKRSITLSTKDLNTLLKHALSQGPGGDARLTMSPGLIQILYTRQFPIPVKPYLNLNILLAEEDGFPVVRRVKIGKHVLPRRWSDWLIRQMMNRFYTDDAYAMLLSAIDRFEPGNDQLKLVYQWQPETLGVKTTVTWPELRDTLWVYQDFLATLAADKKVATGSLSDILTALFGVALTRSQENDPIIENRALLMSLASWARGNQVNPMLQDNASPRIRHEFKVRLQRRRDFARHFIISAALSANAGGGLSDALGLYKELADSEHGSGFSFTDIAAGLAGKEFGSMAVVSTSSARKIQEKMSQGVADDFYMPSLKNLPEHMSHQVFKQQFSHVGSPAYNQMMTDIRLRIDNVKLYQ